MKWTLEILIDCALMQPTLQKTCITKRKRITIQNNEKIQKHVFGGIDVFQSLMNCWLKSHIE